jgi:hypothetical protein
MLPTNLYAELCLQPTASIPEIRAAYRRAALRAHPDKGGSAASFHHITFAFEVLSCPTSRRIYDQKMKQQRHVVPGRASYHISAASVSSRKRGHTWQTKKRHASRTAGGTAANKERRTASHPSTVHPELFAGETDGTNEKPGASNPNSHRLHQASELPQILESLRAAVQALPMCFRKAAITEMPRDVRTNLLTHMLSQGASVSSVSGPGLHRLGQSSVTRAKRHHSWTRGTDVRALKRATATTYQAQMRIRHLRMYTRAQSILDAAVGQQMLLVQARNAIETNGEEVWLDPHRFNGVFNNALLSAGSSFEDLGLSVFIFMRADEWICRPATITSPVMGLKDAVATHMRLSYARQTSWERLRAEWVVLMRQTQHSRVRKLSQEQGMEYADSCRCKLLKHRLKQAVASTERALRCRRYMKMMATRVEARKCRQAQREKSASRVLMKRCTAQKRRGWAVRRRWYKRSDLTMEDIMQGVPRHAWS